MQLLPDQKVEILFYYGAYPLWQLLTKKYDIDIREVCHSVSMYEPLVITHDGSYALRVVDNDYQALGTFPESQLANIDTSRYTNGDVDGNKDTVAKVYTQHATFLLNSAVYVFNALKYLIIRNGDHILSGYEMQFDEHMNLEMVWVSDTGEPLEEKCNAKLGLVFIPK